MTIYLVMGKARQEHSAHNTEWTVKAFKTKEAAEYHAILAQASANLLYGQYPTHWLIPEGANPHDKNFDTGDQGTIYFVTEVEYSE